MVDGLKLFCIEILHFILLLSGFLYLYIHGHWLRTALEICVQFGHILDFIKIGFIQQMSFKILSTQAIDIEKIDIGTHTHTHQYIYIYIHCTHKLEYIWYWFCFLLLISCLCFANWNRQRSTKMGNYHLLTV